MNFYTVLYILGIAANLITCIGYVTTSGMDRTMGYIFFWMPVLWIGVFVALVILLIANAKVAFERNNWGTTFFAILICTPLPSLMTYYFIYFITPPPNR